MVKTKKVENRLKKNYLDGDLKNDLNKVFNVKWLWNWYKKCDKSDLSGIWENFIVKFCM